MLVVCDGHQLQAWIDLTPVSFARLVFGALPSQKHLAVSDRLVAAPSSTLALGKRSAPFRDISRCPSRASRITALQLSFCRGRIIRPAQLALSTKYTDHWFRKGRARGAFPSNLGVYSVASMTVPNPFMRSTCTVFFSTPVYISVSWGWATCHLGAPVATRRWTPAIAFGNHQIYNPARTWDAEQFSGVGIRWLALYSCRSLPADWRHPARTPVYSLSGSCHSANVNSLPFVRSRAFRRMPWSACVSSISFRFGVVSADDAASHSARSFPLGRYALRHMKNT